MIESAYLKYNFNKLSNQTLSFKARESDCLHMLALTVFGPSNLPLAFLYSSCVVASIVSKQSLSYSSPKLSPGELILTCLKKLKDNPRKVMSASFMKPIAYSFFFFFFLSVTVSLHLVNIVQIEWEDTVN